MCEISKLELLGGVSIPWSHISFNHGLLGAEIFSWVNETSLTPNYPLRLLLSLRMSVRCRIADITKLLRTGNSIYVQSLTCSFASRGHDLLLRSKDRTLSIRRRSRPDALFRTSNVSNHRDLLSKRRNKHPNNHPDLSMYASIPAHPLSPQAQKPSSTA